VPVSPFSKLFAVEDAKIAAMTADPSGGTTTYGSLVDVPGIKEVTLSGTVETKSLRGDNTLLDSRSTLQSLTLTVSNAKLSLDVLPLILDGAKVDSGVTPNMVATYDLLGSDSAPPYFKFEAKTPTDGADTIGGDVHIVLYKCTLSGLPDLGFAEEDYRTVGFSATCSPQLGTLNRWLRIVFNETAAAIA
jgi:hypothetical protein